MLLEHDLVVDSLVARDGIEPPTPAFSGLVSAELISLKKKNLARFLPSKSRM
jgi:hypothetical protein